MVKKTLLNYKVERFKEIANELADLYEKKNHNYGDSFGKLYNELGPVAGLVPLWNKLDRATNLIKGDTNHFESLEDTLRDLASYTIMNLIELERDKNLIKNDKYKIPKMGVEESWEDLFCDPAKDPFKYLLEDEEDAEVYSHEH